MKKTAKTKTAAKKVTTAKTTTKKTTTTPTAKTTTTTAKKTTGKKTTVRQKTKLKTAAKRTAKKTTLQTAAKKTAKKLAAKKTTTKTTATKTTTAKTTKAPTLTTGTTAPNFTLPTDSGKVTLKQLRGKNVVLYFYPKDDTPGCTTEACGFRDNLPHFNTLNATVIGVSMDDTASHKKFKTKYKLPFTLASDTTGEVCQQYGVIGQKNMYGKTYTGIIRTTFLIDTTGTIRAIWRNVSVTGHVETVAETLLSLNTLSTGKKTSTKTTATKTTNKKKAA